MVSWTPLKVRIFRSLWLANIVSNIGSTMNDTAAVWTMTAMSGSATLVTLMPAMASLPIFLCALPAGAMADIVDRKRLILAAQVGAFLTAAGMAVLAMYGMLTPGLLLLATFQLGIATAFTTPAWLALVPELVGRQQLPAALALGAVGFNLARAIGPVVGGLLVSSVGPAAVFGLNAVSYAGIAGVLLCNIKVGAPSPPHSSEREQMLGAMAAALRYTSHAPEMKAVLVRAGVQVFGAIAPAALLPLLVRQYGWSGRDFGILMGCYGSGAIFAALFVLPWLRAKFSADHVLAFAAAASATAAGIMAVTQDKIMFGVMLAVAGGGWMCALNTLNVASQSTFPNWVRARSSAIYLVVAQGALAIGAMAWGQLTTSWNAGAALWTAAAWLLCSALLSWKIPIRDVEKLDLSPSNHWRDHSLATEPAPDDGPVLMTVEYRVLPEDSAAFRHAMRALRETRLRDGAFRCSVFRDLDDPMLYRETFIVGSWAEHLRQHKRATVEDQRIEQAVLAFHQGGEPPKTRHLLMVNLRE